MSALGKQCKELLLNGLAPNTRRTYASAQRKFCNFCAQLGISPCPANEQTLCLFITQLSNTIQHPSIKVYLSAVRALHIEKGFSDPLANSPRLHQVFRGIKRSQGTSKDSRLPITDNLMVTIFSSLNLQVYDDCMFWAACTLAYFGFLRSAEFTVTNILHFDPETHLQVSDLSFDRVESPTCLRVWIKASKTGPFRKGCLIFIGAGIPPFCAVSAISAYLHLRGDHRGPLFVFQDGKALTRERLTGWLRHIFSAAGIKGNFSSHSFRIGAATVAARNGVPDYQIQASGRWTSNAYTSYIRTPAEALANISQHLYSLKK